MTKKEIKSMNINFGYSCNNNCIHCLIGKDERDRWKDRTTKEIKDEMLKAKQENVEQLIFIGGEVTIRPDFFELLEFAKENAMKVHLETNGRMFSDISFAKKTFEIMPDLDISMSFHHSKESVHDNITRIEGSFKQSVAGIKNMKQCGLKHLTIIPVIIRLNYKNLPELVKFLSTLGVDEIDFTLLRIGGNAQKNLDNVFVKISEIQPYLFKAIEIGEKTGINIKTYGFPYCTINGYEKHAYELNFIKTFLEGKTYVFNELHDSHIDWQKERIRIKAKTKKCRECIYFTVCEGIWQEYVQQGMDELKPVKINKNNQPIALKEFLN